MRQKSNSQRASPLRERKTVAFELENYNEAEGIFSGYGAVFSNVDSGGDVIEPGAFTKTIAENSERVKILSGHNDGLLPIGKPLELREDEKGLYLEAKISNTALGRDVKTLIGDGVLCELSIGYDPVIFDYDENGIRHLREVKLWEISVVTWAMNEEATITGYKASEAAAQGGAVRKDKYTILIGGTRNMANRKTRRNNAAFASGASKSMKMGTDELKDIIKSAVKEAIGDEEDSAVGVPLEGVTASDILDVVEQAVEAAGEKRKARKDEGEEVEDLTAGEVVEEVAAILTDMVPAGEKEEDSEEKEAEDEEKEDVVEDEEKEGEEEDEAKRRKSAARHSRKSAAAPAQRKYASLFLNSSSARSAGSQKKIPPMVQLARAIKCLDVFGRQDPDRAAFYARKYYNDDGMARQLKALSATNPVNGGFLIPEVYLDEIIELLYDRTVIKELGARTIPLETGNLNIPRMTSGVRAMWGGEARKIQAAQPAFGNLRLSAKRLEAIVPQTRELIMSTKYSADEMFANDLARRMQLGLDWGGLYGTGGEFQPTGIANTKGVEVIDAAKMDAQYANSAGQLTADFPVYIKSLLLSKNVDDQALGWAFNSFTEGYLMNLKTATGDYLYRDEMNAGRFLGIPYATTNQIPTVNGKTDIFFGNWADLMIGDQMGMETFTTMEGSWTDENGIAHNAFEENLVGTRALMYDDIGVRHMESFVYVKNIKVI